MSSRLTPIVGLVNQPPDPEEHAAEDDLHAQLRRAVAGLDEDVITMSIEASRNALARAGISAELLRAVWVGSESHPYAVKPSGTVVAEAIGASASVSAGDWEFACKAGSEAMVAAGGLVGSRMEDYALGARQDQARGRGGVADE